MIRQFEELVQTEDQIEGGYECEFDRLSLFVAHLTIYANC